MLPSTLWTIGPLAVVDSLNPSALAVTMALLGGSDARRRVLVYITGVFATYLTLGIALMLGTDALWSAFGASLEGPMGRGAQLALGATLMAFAIFAPTRPVSRGPHMPDASTVPALFALGVGITILELPTALPYVAAIVLLTAAELPPPVWLIILLAYNGVFVLPPLMLAGAHALLMRQGGDGVGRWKDRLTRGGREATLWVLGIVGFYIAGDATAYFLGIH